MNPVLLDGRSLSDADLRAVAVRPDVVRLRIHGLAQSVAPLSALAPLRELDLTDPRTLDGLEQLQQLESLTLYAFPRITSLNPLGILTHLKKLLLSTPPGYDASRKCYDVESLEPIGRLIDLEAL